MTGPPHPARRVGGIALLTLAVTAAVNAAAWQQGTGWLNTVFLWVTIALLSWGLLEDDQHGGLA